MLLVEQVSCVVKQILSRRQDPADRVSQIVRHDAQDHVPRVGRVTRGPVQPGVLEREGGVRDFPDGVSSNFFHDQVHVGTVLDVTPPYGDFSLSDSTLPLVFLAVLPVGAQGQVLKKRGETPPATKDGLPPEEDTSISVKEYAFNPLQAKKEIGIGNEYYKKGSYRAAAGRYTEATKWNSGEPEAWLRLGEAQEKLKDKKAAREAYGKYLELAADAKNADEIRKKLEKLK